MHGAVVASAPLAVGGQRAHFGGRVRRALRADAAANQRPAPIASITGNRRRGHVASRRHAAGSRSFVVVRASIQEPSTSSSSSSSDVMDEWNEEDIDKIEFAAPTAADSAAISNKDGAGATMAAPDWLTQLNRLWGGDSEIPVVGAERGETTRVGNQLTRRGHY